MGDLSKTPLKGVYDTEVDDVVSDFYIPMLSNCESYDRLSGFFRSSVLSASSKGIVELIKNRGHMRLVCSPFLDVSDAEALNRCFNDPSGFEKTLSEVMIKGLTTEFLNDESSEAMAWLVLNKYLDIHIVVVRDPNGMIVASDNEKQSGMFHTKIGIFKDFLGNIVSFSGSINESYSGLVENIEEFDVFCSWKAGNDEHIYPHIEKFERYWTIGKRQRSETFTLPEAVKREWVKIAPSDYKDLKLFKRSTEKFKLREYQNTAISAWADNNYRGIFNMATGTGKTITAIFAVKNLQSTINDKHVLIIAVPYQHLIENPWKNSLNKFMFNQKNDYAIIEAFGDSNKWKKDGLQYVPDYKLGLIKTVVVLTTYDTLYSENLVGLVDKFNGKKILVADEVHNAGADIYRNGLRDEYEYRLGLSATPDRYFDDEGTKYIYRYFEKEVYTFSLRDAINKINPDTGETYLSPYYYRPIFVTLTESELNLYSEINTKVARCLPKEGEPTPEQLRVREMLLLKRARVIKNASRKLEKLVGLIPKFKDEGIFDHCLIYCSDGKDSDDREIKVIQRVVRELNNNSISNRRFTFGEKMDDRKIILDDFALGSVSTIVAIKCLDEGVDVPATKNAIIMASTGNSREYIQRRGRILRRFKGKKYSVLFDFIVIPNSDEPSDEEIQIIQSEYKRYKEFSDLSLNKGENEKIIEELLKKYNITIGDSGGRT